VILYFGQFLKNTEMAQISGLLLACLKVCLKFDKEEAWATFKAIFSQTHLVTLPETFFPSARSE
jgi:hypothetical protein